MDDELEKFEITEDDMENMFTIKKRHKISKEQRIYGIWAEEEYANEPSPSVFKESLQSSKYGNQGFNFVSGGIIQEAGKEALSPAHESEDQLDQISDSSEDDTFRPSFGNNLGKSRKSEYQRVGVDVRIPTGYNAAIGDWEKHTTGIGSKLLKMMGYEKGKGLGKNLQGIATPVEANKRRGKGAIGFYGQEVKTKNRLVEKEEKEVKSEACHQWRKGQSKKVKYVYKSAEEAIRDGKYVGIDHSKDNHIVKTKVIDMTGPETRVLSSYHAISGQNTRNDYDKNSQQYEHFDLPELVYNLEFLVDKSERDIIDNAKRLDREENQIVHLSHERKKYEVILEREEAELQGMNEALVMVDDLESNHVNNDLTLSQALMIFTELKNSYPGIYYSFELPFLSNTYCLALFKELFSTWEPLQSPNEYTNMMREWQSLIEMENSKVIHTQPSCDQQMDPYHAIMYEAWLPRVCSAIMDDWNPKACQSLLLLMDNWVPPLLPHWIQANLLQSVLLPKITQAVHNWNPMKDTIAIHTWLHPWLPLMADHLQGVYPVIQQKLSSALVLWHPSDRSAKMVLQPWKRVFSETSLTNLIQCSIQTKLESALMEMTISPHNQKLDAWQWFCDWEDLLPTAVLLDILEKCFFPRWYQTLGSWLSTGPAYNDVVIWYKGWRDIMPKKAYAHPQVKQKFQQSLEICRKALSFQPGASEQFTLLLTGLEKIMDPPPPPPSTSPRKVKSKDWATIINSARDKAPDDQTSKEYIEKKCLEKDVLFTLMPDHNYEGRPVYRCGNKKISFYNDYVFIYRSKTGWSKRNVNLVMEEVLQSL